MPIRPSFAFHSGELSPQMQSRADLERYQTGLARCQNAVVLPTGGISNRAGMYYLAAAKSNTDNVRLIPFIAATNPSGSLVLEFIHQKVYFWKNYARIIDVGGHGDGTINQDLYYTTPFAHGDLFDIQFTQVGDTLILTHPSYAPYRLFRVFDDEWTKGNISFASWTPATTPAITNVVKYGSGSFTTARRVPWWWVYTIVNADGQESLPSPAKLYDFVTNPPYNSANNDSDPNPDCPVQVTGTSHADAVEYRFYRGLGIGATAPGVYGYVGSSKDYRFIDRGAEPAYTESAPEAYNPFSGSGKYPSCAAFYEDRLFFAGTNGNPFAVYGSRTGDYFNFDSPLFPLSDSSVIFRLASKKADKVQHIIPLRRLIVLTTSAEWYVQGGGGEPITPFDIEARAQSYHGSSRLRALPLNDSVLFVQNDIPVVRDLYYDWQLDGLTSNELSVLSSHLFQGHLLRDWDHAPTPHSTIWAVRDDGLLLSACYRRDYGNIGWARHVTQGTVESVAVIPGSASDYSSPSIVYVVVRRRINGSYVKYIEALSNREAFYDVRDSRFLDAMLTYDFRNRSTGFTMTLSGGTTWAAGEEVTLTASTGIFTSAYVGDRFVVDDPTNPSGYTYAEQTQYSPGYFGSPPPPGAAPFYVPPDPYNYNSYETEQDRFNDQVPPVFMEIIGYTSGTAVTVRLLSAVPTTLRNVATSYWARQPKTFPPTWLTDPTLSHLEGATVGVLADGNVHRDVVVSSGRVTLDYHAAIVQIGLRYETEIQTLELAPPAVGRNKNVSRAMVKVERSRGFSMGPRADLLTERPEKIDPTQNWFPTPLSTEEVEFRFQGVWQRTGQLVIRQSNPLPLTVLSIAPEFEVGN